MYYARSAQPLRHVRVIHIAGYVGCNTGMELISPCIMYVFAAATRPWFEIMDLCVLCKTNTGEKLSKLTDVGLETLRNACKLRHCDEIGQLLEVNQTVFCTQLLS